MLRLLVRRILTGALVMWIVTTSVFILFFLTSPDPAARFAGKLSTPQTRALLRHRLGLDEPVAMQYWHFLSRLCRGDFGYSYVTRSPVNDMIKDALPVSMSLVFGAAALWMTIGLAGGVFAATRAHTLLDRGLTAVSILGVSVPAFIIGMNLLYLFAVKLPVFPLTGYVPIWQNPLEWCEHLVLPWISTALLQAVFYIRLTRGSLLDVLGEDYIRTARAKGLTERRVVFGHGLRAALTAVVTQFGIDVGSMLGGLFVTEPVFGLPGLGQLTLRSMRSGDLPIIVAVVLLAAFFLVIANIIVDIAYTFLDPRIRLY